MGQACGHGAENGDTSLRPVKDSARRDRSGNCQKSTGKRRSDAMAEHDGGYNCELNLHRQQMDMGQRSKHFDDLAESAAAVDIDAKHFTQHSDADLKADANEEAQ